MNEQQRILLLPSKIAGRRRTPAYKPFSSLSPFFFFHLHTGNGEPFLDRQQGGTQGRRQPWVGAARGGGGLRKEGRGGAAQGGRQPWEGWRPRGGGEGKRGGEVAARVRGRVAPPPLWPASPHGPRPRPRLPINRGKPPFVP